MEQEITVLNETSSTQKETLHSFTCDLESRMVVTRYGERGEKGKRRGGS